jgi:DNA-binding LacI/PurR family transcriptional regulator
MPITRDQVAKEAGVSSATVSRVFNNPNAVSETLREKVISVAKKLNYVPNKAASQLRRSGTGVIGVVKINKSDRLYYWGSITLFDWFYAQAQKGMLKAIENTSYRLSFYTIKTQEELLDITKKVDAIIGYDIDTKIEESYFENIKVPYLLAHHIRPNDNFLHVSTDNEFGGKLQGEFLKQKGVKNPLYITGYLDQVLSHKQRYDGIRQIYPKILKFEVDFLDNSEISKMVASLAFLISEKNIDGIAFVNDLVLVKTITKVNLELPIIGYDGAPYVSLIDNVASIDFHIDEIYELALTKIINILNGKSEKGEKVYPTIL